MKVGRIELDLDGRRVLVAGRQLLLTPKEFQLLQCLMEHAGTAVDRQYLLDQVWGADFDLDPKTLTVHVMRLRKRLIQHGTGDCIRTVRGQGYVFEKKAGQR
jgi:DNA-binding response OmpR family regulator